MQLIDLYIAIRIFKDITNFKIEIKIIFINRIFLKIRYIKRAYLK